MPLKPLIFYPVTVEHLRSKLLPSLARESRVSVPLPIDSFSDSRRVQERLHIERSKILEVLGLLAVASEVEPIQEFDPVSSQSSKLGQRDR